MAERLIVQRLRHGEEYGAADEPVQRESSLAWENFERVPSARALLAAGLNIAGEIFFQASDCRRAAATTPSGSARRSS